MKSKEKYIVNYELIDILGQMNTELMSIVNQGQEYFEVSEIETVFNCYLKDIKNVAEDMEVEYLRTKEDYIKHYDKLIKQAKAKIEEFEELKREVLM